LLRADNVSFAHGGRRKPGRTATPYAAQDFPGPAPGIHHVSLSIERGDLVGILGPNGSGKTTLLRLLGGLLQPADGRVTLDGTPVGTIPGRELARRVAMVPQETHLAFDYSVIEVALMGRYPHLGTFELEGPRDIDIAREALAATGTAHLDDRSFATLSGGEKQRVVIASALAQEADILLLDEPTASLDLGYQVEIAALVARLNRDRRLTVVVATHDLGFATSLCRSLVLLKSGAVLAAGPVRETLTAGSIESLYGVRADVRFDDRARRVTVVPLERIPHA